MNRSIHRLTVFPVLAFCAALGAQNAAAPDSTSGQDDVVLDEIVVTASKREERLFDVPAAVSTLGSEKLERPYLVGNTTPRSDSYHVGRDLGLLLLRLEGHNE